MPLDPIHAFYCRKDYLSLAQSCKVKSGGICARCGGVFDLNELRPHHKIELTLDNIDDTNITLNPDNIEVLCHACHNAVHSRFGNAIGAKRVYLVHGSPYAGKTTYVASVATRNDIVVDLERIHAAICVCGQYDKPDATKRIAFNIPITYSTKYGRRHRAANGKTLTLSAVIPTVSTAIISSANITPNSST